MTFQALLILFLPNRLISDLCSFIDESWLIHWLVDFLQGWSRQVKLQKGYSSTSEIRVGVPQGGPLSALLFTIYTDEIRSNSNCSVIKYADDTAISCNISKLTHHQNQCDYQDFITKIVSTCDEKNLLLNPKKSKEMVFKNINIKHKGLIDTKEEKTVIHGSYVERVSYTMYLGLCIDNKLTFTNHISKILSKVYYIVSSLMYIARHFSIETRMKVFNASIVPHIIYAVPVWYHFIHIKDKKRIKSFLKYCAQIFCLEYDLLENQVNLAARREFVRLAKSIHNSKDHPLHLELTSLCNNTKYNLRNTAVTPSFRIILFKNSFIYRAALFIQNGVLDPLL